MPQAFLPRLVRRFDICENDTIVSSTVEIEAASMATFTPHTVPNRVRISGGWKKLRSRDRWSTSIPTLAEEGIHDTKPLTMIESEDGRVATHAHGATPASCFALCVNRVNDLFTLISGSLRRSHVWFYT